MLLSQVGEFEFPYLSQHTFSGKTEILQTQLSHSQKDDLWEFYFDVTEEDHHQSLHSFSKEVNMDGILILRKQLGITLQGPLLTRPVAYTCSCYRASINVPFQIHRAYRLWQIRDDAFKSIYLAKKEIFHCISTKKQSPNGGINDWKRQSPSSKIGRLGKGSLPWYETQLLEGNRSAHILPHIRKLIDYFGEHTIRNIPSIKINRQQAQRIGSITSTWTN